MAIGKVIDLPSAYSQYARVRDEYGMVYTVHGSELASDAEENDEMSYKVDIWQNPTGSATTLRGSEFEPDES